MKRFWRRTRVLLKKIGRILVALFKKLGTLAWQALKRLGHRLYQFLTSLPPRTLWYGIGGMSLVLVAVLILVIALPSGRTPTQAAVGGDLSAQLAATNVPVLQDTPVESPKSDAIVIDGADDAAGDAQNGGDTNDAVDDDAAVAEPTATPFEMLEEGDDGEIIATIQTRLMELGYMDSDEPTEHFGPLTESAIEAFQRHNGLTSDGKIGSQTYAMLMSGEAKAYVMQVGDEGEDVKAVQQRLYELGYITDKGNITGTFGEKTEAAVKEFQERNKLTGDGKVGNVTMEKLYSSEVISKFYSVGDESDEIKTFQERLQKLGYYDGKASGEFTKATATAVREFQAANGLVVDGNVGPATKALLLSDDAQAKVIKLGDSGSDVTAIQERLAELGYMRAANATGYFGEITQEAVMAFQRRNSLGADGKVGTVTLKTLNSSSAKKAASSSSSSGSSSSGSSSSGSSSSGSSSSGSSSSGSSSSGSSSSSSGVERLIDVAESKLGCKYVRGAKGPNSFDCSGFVYWCLNQAGVKQSYMTSIAWRSCTKYKKITSMSDIKRGDILVFSDTSMATGHVGIYLGSGKMIDASSGAGKVRVTSTVLSGSYWPSHFLMAFRIF